METLKVIGDYIVLPLLAALSFLLKKQNSLEIKLASLSSGEMAKEVKDLSTKMAVFESNRLKREDVMNEVKDLLKASETHLEDVIRTKSHEITSEIKEKLDQELTRVIHRVSDHSVPNDIKNSYSSFQDVMSTILFETKELKSNLSNQMREVDELTAKISRKKLQLINNEKTY